MKDTSQPANMLIFQYKGFGFYSEILLLMEMCWTELTDLWRCQHVVSASVDIKRATTVIAKNYCIVWCSFLFMWGYALLIMYSSKELCFSPQTTNTPVFLHMQTYSVLHYTAFTSVTVVHSVKHRRQFEDKNHTTCTLYTKHTHRFLCEASGIIS